MSLSEYPIYDVPGNAGTYANLAVYGKVVGILSPGDRDWYRVYLEAGRTYTVLMSDRDDPELVGDFPYDSWVRLYDAAGKYIASGTEDGSISADDSQLVFTPKYSGTYYVEARGSSISLGTGSYSVELLAQGSSTDIAETMQTAQRLLSRTPFSSAIDLPTDVDFVKVDLEPGKYYTVSAVSANLANLNVELYNQTGQFVRSLDSGDTFSVESVGTHFLAVSSEDRTATGTYTLEWFQPAARISITGGYSATQSVANESVGVINFTVRLSNPVGSSVSVLVSSISDVTATADTDFPGVKQLVVFAPGETVKEFTVPIINDGLAEPAEAFGLYLSSPTGGVSLDSRSVMGYIFDDDFQVPTVNGVGLFDPYTMYQWYLYADTGANVVEAWKSYTGKGVSVAVFDQGIDPTQVDLDGNLRLDLSRQAGNLGAGGAPIYAGDNHGTAVAGVIAAEHNGVNVTGVAFDAQLISIYTSFGNGPEDYEAGNRNAFTYAANFDVLNDSWGYAPRQAYQAIDYDWAFYDNFLTATFDSQGRALKSLAETGRNGLGTIVVQSAGNSYAIGDDTNLHNYQNSRYIITVAATDYLGNVTEYSSPGSSVLVAAPGGGGGGGLSDIFTTDRTGLAGYSSQDFTNIAGTSFSAPIVSGIVALMLEANSALGYRDVQQILAYSARITSGQYNTWSYNGARDWNGGGLHYDAVTHDLGFGLVDALAATRLAETWGQNSASAANDVELITIKNAPVAIPDSDSRGLTQTITEARAIMVERVEVTIDLIHTFIGDLGLLLTAPSGTQSWLIYRPGTNELAPFGQDQDNINFTFDTVLSMGESSVGDWTLSVFDLAAGDIGELRAWTLNLIGKSLSSDNTYVYTNEYSEAVASSSARAALADTEGFDTINAAAVTTSSILDLTPGSTSLVDGAALTIAANTYIEAVFGGDGNDVITGNVSDNSLSGGRGNDILKGGVGNDTLDGGLGNDTAEYEGNSANYVVKAVATGFQISSLADGVDTLRNVEVVKFADKTTPIIASASASESVFNGTPGADVFVSTDSSDLIFGFEGIDSVLYSSDRDSFRLTKSSSDGWTVEGLLPGAGTDLLSEVERIQFADKKLALDLESTQNAGLALEFIGVLAPTFISNPSVVGLIMGFFDQGSSLHDVCQLAIDVGLVTSLAGSDGNADLARLVFRNVVGSEADPAMVDLLVGYMDGRNASFTQADFLTVIAGMEINQNHINLVGLQQTGIEFI